MTRLRQGYGVASPHGNGYGVAGPHGNGYGVAGPHGNGYGVAGPHGNGYGAAGAPEGKNKPGPWTALALMALVAGPWLAVWLGWRGF